jgi:hypothetical protein
LNREFQGEGLYFIMGMLRYLGVELLVKRDTEGELVISPTVPDAWISWQWLHHEQLNPEFDEMFKDVWASLWRWPDGKPFQNTCWSFPLVGGLS